MGISGIGSVFSYNYNLQTKRFSSGKGLEKDEFAKYYNDDLKDEESSTLNGYDQRTKGAVKTAIDRMPLETSSDSAAESVDESGEPYGRSRVEMLVKQYGEESPYSKALRALEKSFDATFSNIPDTVKDDWIEMCIDSGVNQITGISLDGKESHISQIMMQKAVNDYNMSQGNYQYVDFGWGKSVESLMGILNKGIHDIDNPLSGQPERSDSVKKLVENERNFYVGFLEKMGWYA